MAERAVEVTIFASDMASLEVRADSSQEGDVCLTIDGNESWVPVAELRDALDFVTGNYLSARADA